VRSTFASLFILVAVLSVVPAAGQTATTGIVLGTVTDPAGGVVPDAKVDLTNTATNELRTAQANSAGQYVFPNIVPGDYTLKLDSSIGKKTALTERVSFSITADFSNLFNHVNFVDPTLDRTQKASFGVISTQLVPTNRDNTLADGSRWIQLGLRIDF
jgi:protocatechuate 3,4-dioxygenase beta subunit